MAEKNSCVSIYPTTQAAAQALGDLLAADCELRNVSVVGKGCHAEDHTIGFYRAAERICYCGCQGRFWDDVWNQLADAAFFWVPGYGPLVAAGRIVPLMVRGLEDVEIGGGFSVPGAALHGIGVPRGNIDEYEQAIQAEKLLLLVHGERCDVEQAYEILHCETQQVTVHSA